MKSGTYQFRLRVQNIDPQFLSLGSVFERIPVEQFKIGSGRGRGDNSGVSIWGALFPGYQGREKEVGKEEMSCTKRL